MFYNFGDRDMRKVRLVVETSLHPKSLQMVLQEAVVNPTGFITKVEVEEEEGLYKKIFAFTPPHVALSAMPPNTKTAAVEVI